MFYANSKFDKDFDAMTVNEVFDSGSMYFNFNGKKYHTIQLHMLCSELADMILAKGRLSSVHYSEKIYSYLMNLNFNVFLNRCRLDNIIFKLTPAVEIEYHETLNKGSRTP